MRHVALLLVAILIMSTAPTQLPEFDSKNHSSSDESVAKVPTWRIGDKWIYAGRFDAETMIRENGVSAAVGEIQGDAEMVVLDIIEMDVENRSTLVYKTRMTADFDKNGVELDGYSGNLFIDYEFIEFIRVSDLASIKSDLALEVKFSALGFINIDVADITIHNTYAPPNEIYDFPMRNGERWLNNYTQETTWSGSSDYISPLPPDETGPEQGYFGVTKIGAPINDKGHTISYGGCQNSYEVTGWDQTGAEESYRWWCPDIRNHAWLHTEDDAGLTMDFRIKSYDPVGSSAVDINSDPGTRDETIEVELEFQLFSLDTNLSVWANLSSSRAGEDIEFRHERTGWSTTTQVPANGTVHTIFDSGSEFDASWTSSDHSSHGIIAWLPDHDLVGDSTLTLDLDVVAMDLLAVPDRANIERNRSGTVVELNELTGWNVIPGDILRLELPVMNRGITSSAPATVETIDPSGNEDTYSIPAIASLEQILIEVFWTVPEEAGFGIVTMEWTVIPGMANSNDAEPTNDHGELALFVGRIPEVSIANHSVVLTNEELWLDASNSNDPDGGRVWCSFYIEYDDGIKHRNVWTTVWSADCTLNWSWIDDGVYSILVTVVDEERDSASLMTEISIVNRPPEVRVIASRMDAASFGTISLLAVANDSDSQDVWPGVVDIHWPDADCEEGWYTDECTVTWNEEGLRRYTAVATDDDGATSSAYVDLFWNNIAPFNLEMSLFGMDEREIAPDQQGVWHVAEDTEVWLFSRADDSLNDLDTLNHLWTLGDELSPVESGTGLYNSHLASWSESGEKNLTLTIVDDDGVSSSLDGIVQVHNVPPVIEGLDDPLPVAESQLLKLEAEANDTISDQAGLRVCWDVDPGQNADELGGADDDCDVIGKEFAWSWSLSGVYPVVVHVVDDDGARASQIVNITVMNQPPRVKVSIPETILVGTTVELDASATTDAASDMDNLVFMWDLDLDKDSNGDGDSRNDVDERGTSIKIRWNEVGEYSILLRVADEDRKNPGEREILINVVEDEGGLIDTVSSQVVGPDASILVQIGLAILGLLVIAFLVSRFRPRDEIENWVDSEQAALAAGLQPELLQETGPAHSPPGYAFKQEPAPVAQTEPQLPANPPSMAGLLDELDI